MRKIHKRDAPFRAVFEVKTLAVLFPPYPREMKTNTRNLNLPPFCRLFVSIGPGKRRRIVADTLSGTQKMFLILFRNILCPQQMFPSLRSPRKIMGNNVSATMCPRLPGPLQATAQFPHMFHTDTRYLSRTSSHYVQPLRRARAQDGHPLITDIFVG